MPDLIACVLAAGKGTRMKSNLPKVMHPIWSKPMLDYVTAALAAVQVAKTFIIVGYGQELVREHLKGASDFELVVQDPPMGTGHAVQQIQPYLKNYEGEVLILSGDMPLITAEVLQSLLQEH